MTPTLGVPLQPDREEGRRLLREELTDPVYAAAEPGPLERLLTWLWAQLTSIELPAGPGGSVLLAVTVVVGVVAVASALRFAGPLRRRARTAGAGELFAGGTATAAEHRALAEHAAAAGRWGEAVRERFRAVVRSMEERVLLDARPGSTAHEAAAEATRSLPDAARELLAGADVFDTVVYGDRPATSHHYRQIVALDELVADTRPSSRVAEAALPVAPR